MWFAHSLLQHRLFPKFVVRTTALVCAPTPEDCLAQSIRYLSMVNYLTGLDETRVTWAIRFHWNALLISELLWKRKKNLLPSAARSMTCSARKWSHSSALIWAWAWISIDPERLFQGAVGRAALGNIFASADMKHQWGMRKDGVFIDSRGSWNTALCFIFLLLLESFNSWPLKWLTGQQFFALETTEPTVNLSDCLKPV